MSLSDRLRLFLFYRAYPELRGPVAPDHVGTYKIEHAWRYAEQLGFEEGRGRERVTFDYEERGWSP